MFATEAYKNYLELLQHIQPSKQHAFTKTYLSQLDSDEEREEVSQLIDLIYAGLPPPPKKILVLIHGIRTQGKWFDLLENQVRKSGDFEVRHCKYGFYDALRFWIPIPWLFRIAPINKVQRTINTIIGSHPGAELCVVAHSNGTYILSKLVQKNPQINFKKIVLCGSIVNEDHLWSEIKQQDRNLFINECGTKDIWPVLAKTSTFGYGASGRFGFNHPEITNRYHDCGHDGFFTEDFFTKFWIPFLMEGRVEQSEWNLEKPDEKWIIAILGLFPGALLFYLSMLTIICLVYWGVIPLDLMG